MVVNYQKYVDEILDIVYEAEYKCNYTKVREIGIKVNEKAGSKGLFILSEMLCDQIGNDFIGCLREIECSWSNINYDYQM